MAEEYNTATEAKTTISYNCPNCQAGLIFDPEKGKFLCEFCLSEFTEEELSHTDAAEKAKKAEENAEDFCGHMNEYICPACGAEVVADDTTAASFCCYCHNPIVLQGRLHGQMKPDKIVPFKIGKEDAEKRFIGWAKKKIFAPRAFSEQKQVEKIQGIYYPFWVTDADTDASMEAHATRVRSWRIGNTMFTETSHFRVRRAGEIHFEDISTAALKEADKKVLEGILPYPSDELIPFSLPYLSGFTAKKRNIERKELVGEVRDRMHTYASELLRQEVSGYTTVNVTACDVRVFHSNWDYTLMPLWMLVYKGKKRDYTYALNGATGKVYGEIPISPIKLGLFALGVFVVAAALFALIGGAVL